VGRAAPQIITPSRSWHFALMGGGASFWFNKQANDLHLADFCRNVSTMVALGGCFGYNAPAFSIGSIMTQDEMKKAAGWAALKYGVPGTIVGVGTGSTVNHFIDALATMKDQIKGAVSSSIASTEPQGSRHPGV
jgi:hypothetical protein